MQSDYTILYNDIYNNCYGIHDENGMFSLGEEALENDYFSDGIIYTVPTFGFRSLFEEHTFWAREENRQAREIFSYYENTLDVCCCYTSHFALGNLYYKCNWCINQEPEYDSNSESSDEFSVSDFGDEEEEFTLLLPVIFTRTFIESTEECTICMTSDMENHLSLFCGHIFHEQCIEIWFSNPLHRSCPLCRGEPQMFARYNAMLENAESTLEVVRDTAVSFKDTVDTYRALFDELCRSFQTSLAIVGKVGIGFDIIIRLHSISKYDSSFMDGVSAVWNIVMIFKQLSSLFVPNLDEFFDSLDSPGEAQASFFDCFITSSVLTGILPPALMKILDFVNRHSRVKFLSDVGSFSSIVQYSFSLPLVLFRYIQENSPLFTPVFKALGDYYELFLSYIPGSTQYAMQQRAVTVLTAFNKTPNVIKTSYFITEFKEVYEYYTSSQYADMAHLDRVPEGFKTTLTGLKALSRVINSIDRTVRVEPIWIYAVGPPGCGKTTMMSRIIEAMSDYTVYPHHVSPGQKEFFDSYCNEDIFWEEDITSADQLRKYLQLISSFVVPLEVCDSNMKGLKRFTTPIILTTSNLRIEDLLSHKDQLEHQKALKRRCFVLDFTDVQSNGIIYTVRGQHVPSNVFVAPTTVNSHPTVNVFKYDPVSETENLVCSFDPNNSVDWFEAFVFKELDNNSNLIKARPLVRKIQKRALPQIFERMKPIWDHVVLNLVNVGAGAYLKLDSAWEWILDKVSTMCCVCHEHHLFSECIFECGHHVCVSCLRGLNLAHHTTCPLCRRPIRIATDTLLTSIASLPLDKAALFTGVAVALLSSLVSMCIGIGVELCKKKFNPEKTKVESDNIYVAPPTYGNVRKTTNRPPLIYATTQGKIYPSRATTEMSECFEKLRNNMLKVTIVRPSSKGEGFVTFVDGYHLLMPAHYLVENGSILDSVQIFGNDQENAQLLSGQTFIVDYLEMDNDVAILKFKHPTPPLFPSVASRFDISKANSKKFYFLTPEVLIPIDAPTYAELSVPYFSYSNGEVLYPHGSMEYDIQAPGMCGALIVDENGKVFGFHVAYNPFVNKGIARPFRRNIRNVISKCKADGLTRKLSPISAYVLESDIFRSVPDKTQIVKSDLHGVFPIEREPAVLRGKNENGEDILQTAVKKNIKSVKIANPKALDFVRVCLKKFLGTRKSELLSENEIVCGRPGFFPGFDKQSSAGIPFNRKNKDLLDYENGSLGAEVQREIYNMRKEYASGDFRPSSIVFGDTLKDELRDTEKIYKPRLFAAGPVHFAAELKRLFGDLVSRMQKSRMRNGIMIGINALGKEWDAFARRMVRLGPNIIPGDFANWDGGMLTVVQEIVNDVLSSLTYEPTYALWLLSHLIRTTRVVLSDTIVTTHSIPSGHFLTAFYNSIVNFCYVAYAYYELTPQSKHNLEWLADEFFKHIFSAKYGDDVLINVDSFASEFFNAFSFTDVMNDIGIGFTSETKKKHEKPFYLLEECTFLRRSFKFSNVLMRVVGPLNRTTMLSTLSWVTDRMRMEELVDLKVDNFQREAFLHEDYEILKNILNEKYQEVYGFEAPFLDDYELLQLYQDNKIDNVYSCPQNFSSLEEEYE